MNCTSVLTKDQMDIKRKLSPHLGDDLAIRIYFGEIIHQPTSSTTSPSSPLALQTTSLLSDDVKPSGQSIELTTTNRSNGKYHEVSRVEEL